MYTPASCAWFGQKLGAVGSTRWYTTKVSLLVFSRNAKLRGDARMPGVRPRSEATTTTSRVGQKLEAFCILAPPRDGGKPVVSSPMFTCV